MSDFQAVILTGGLGVRLRPFTFSLPKPLVPIEERPILDIVLCQLRAAGAREIILSTGYLAELIEAYCGNGSRWKLPIRYIRESKPLNTAGCLKLISGLEEQFLVMNGDILTTMDIEAFWSSHNPRSQIATLAMCNRTVPIDFGVITARPDGSLEQYIEKPTLSYQVSMGVQVLSRRAVDYIHAEEAISMPDLLLRMKEKGERIVCHAASGEWLDIGRPEDYERAQDRFRTHRHLYLPDDPK